MGGITPILIRLWRREGTTWAGDAIFILLCGPPRRAIVILNETKWSESAGADKAVDYLQASALDSSSLRSSE